MTIICASCLGSFQIAAGVDLEALGLSFSLQRSRKELEEFVSALRLASVPRSPFRSQSGESFSRRRSQKPTWRDEAVEVADDGAEGGPERGLVVHAAGDQVGQFGPLWGRQLEVFGVEQALLWREEGKQGEVNKASVLW